MVLLMFFEALYFGHFLSFYTMQLEPPKYGSASVVTTSTIMRDGPWICRPDPHSLISAPMDGVMGEVEEVLGLVFYLLPCSDKDIFD